MPYYSSIETRYKANASDTNNRSYTANDDNMAGIVGNDSNLSYTANTNDKEILVEDLVELSLTEDLIAFDRVFRFPNVDSKLYGASSNSGVHAYFVNCTFRVQALIQENAGGTRTPFVGHSPGDWNNTRAVDIPTNETGTGQSGWHFYNCKFVFEVGGSDAMAIMHGDLYDCTMLQTVANVADFVFYPMGNSVIRNFYSDVSAIDTAGNGNYSGYAFQFSRELEEVSGLQLQNQYLYPIGDGLDFEFPILSAEQIIPYTSSSGDSGTPANPPVLRFGEFSTLISSATLASPKVNIREDGQIFWRNARNTAEGADQNRAIASRRFERDVFSDVNQTTRRADVKYTFTTNVDYTTAGNGRSIAVASSNATRTYTTDSTGIPQGTYNFVNGSTSASDEAYPIIDIPISYFRADTGTDVTDDFQTLQFDFTTNLEVNSLFGMTDTTATFDATSWAADQAAADADDGFWIPHDVENTVDLDDPNMVNYQSIGSIVGAGGTENIDVDGIYAKYKYAWYQKDISHANIPHDNVTDGVFDFSSLTVNDLAITNEADDAPYSIDTNTINIRAASLVAADTDVVTHLIVDTASLNRTGLEANLDANTMQELRQYDDDASDFDPTDADTFTAKGCELGGNLNITTTDGSNNVAVFRDVTWKSGTVVRRTPGATAPVKVYLTGTTPVTNVTFTNISEVIGIVIITVDLATAVSAIGDVDALFFSSADGSTFTALTASAEINADLDQVVYTVEYDPSVSGNEIYFSVLAKQNTMVSGKTTSDSTYSSEAISTAALDEDYTPAADTDDEIALSETSNPLTFTEPTSNTAALNALFQYTSDALTVTNDGGRNLLRRIEKTEEWRSGVAKGYIPADYFVYGSEAVQFLSQTEADRISIRRSSSAHLWNVQTRVIVVDPPVDLYKQLSTTVPNTYIEFQADTAGAGINEILDALNNTRDEIRGTGNRTVTEAYNQAKGAKNAVFAS